MAIWFGAPWLALITIAAAAIMAWEWARLCGDGRVGAAGAAMGIAVMLAVAVSALGATGGAVVLALAGTAIVFATARATGRPAPVWLAGGTLWVALPCILLLWLARPDGAGRSTLLWLFAVVWATDVGAYFVGRSLGGPRLAPRWSPGKTWAGLVGGMVCAAFAGLACAALLGISPVLPTVLISAGLAIVGQFGDLAESVAKRRFGVKDSSGLIPGHGGLLDRLDGMLAVIPVVALLSLLGGEGLLPWR